MILPAARKIGVGRVSEIKGYYNCGDRCEAFQSLHEDADRDQQPGVSEPWEMEPVGRRRITVF